MGNKSLKLLERHGKFCCPHCTQKDNQGWGKGRRKKSSTPKGDWGKVLVPDSYTNIIWSIIVFVIIIITIIRDTISTLDEGRNSFSHKSYHQYQEEFGWHRREVRDHWESPILKTQVLEVYLRLRMKQDSRQCPCAPPSNRSSCLH